MSLPIKLKLKQSEDWSKSNNANYKDCFKFKNWFLTLNDT